MIKWDSEKRMPIVEALLQHAWMAAALCASQLLRFSPSEKIAMSLFASDPSHAPKLRPPRAVASVSICCTCVSSSLWHRNRTHLYLNQIFPE